MDDFRGRWSSSSSSCRGEGVKSSFRKEKDRGEKTQTIKNAHFLGFRVCGGFFGKGKKKRIFEVF